MTTEEKKPKRKAPDKDEQQQAAGHQDAYRQMLVVCLEQLGYKDPLRQAVLWASDRAAALASLRTFCEILGLSSDWPSHIRLTTVIEKYILPQYRHTISVGVPLPVLDQLKAEWGEDFSRHMTEAMAVEAYRTGALNSGQVAEFLALSQEEADGFLKERGMQVPPQTAPNDMKREPNDED